MAADGGHEGVPFWAFDERRLLVGVFPPVSHAFIKFARSARVKIITP